MTLLVVCCLWVLAGTGVAMLPMRYQFVPGAALMAAAPVLLWLIWRDASPWLALLAFMAFLSMFRRPLRYYSLCAIGRKPEARK